MSQVPASDVPGGAEGIRHEESLEHNADQPVDLEYRTLHCSTQVKALLCCTDSDEPFSIGSFAKVKSDKIMDKILEQGPFLTCKVQVMAEDVHISYLQLDIIIHYEENGRPADKHIWYRFARERILKIEKQYFNLSKIEPPATIHEVREKFQQFSHIDPRVMFTWLNDKLYKDFWELSIKHNTGDKWAFGLFSNTSYGHPVDEQLQKLRNILTSPIPKNLRLIIQTTSIAGSIRKLSDKWTEQSIRGSPLDKFYKSRAQYVEKKNHLVPSHKFPRYTIYPPKVFKDEQEYFTIHGVAIIQEAEVQQEAHDRTFEVGLTLIRPNPANNNVFLGFIQKSQLATDFEDMPRLRPGDSVDIRVDEIRSHDFTGTVTQPFLHPEAGTITLIVKRQDDKSTQEYSAFDFGESVVDCDTRDPDAIQKAISSAEPFYIKLALNFSDKTFKRQLSATVSLQKWGSTEVLSLLLGNSSLAEDLPRNNLFETIRPDDLAKFLAGSNLTEKQMEAFSQWNELPAGFGLVVGPPGTGKTFMIVETTRLFIQSAPKTAQIREFRSMEPRISEGHLLRCKSLGPTIHDAPESGVLEVDFSEDEVTSDFEYDQQFFSARREARKDSDETKLKEKKNGPRREEAKMPQPMKNKASPPSKHQVLILAPINEAVDKLARDVSRRFGEGLCIPGRQAIVVRLHSWTTERFISRNEHNRHLDDVPKTTLRIFRDELKELDLKDKPTAAKARDHIEQATRQRFAGIRDKRVQLLEHALGMWMLILAGVAEPVHPLTDRKRFAMLANEICDYMSGESRQWPQDQRDAFASRLDELRKYTLQCADVLVTTTSNASDALVFSTFAPVAIFVDEGAKVPEADYRGLLIYYPYSRGVVSFADTRQLGVHSEGVHPKGFRAVMFTSLFSRLLECGHPVTKFVTQSRCVPSICDFWSSLFYNNEIVTASNVTNSSRPNAVLGSHYNRAKFNIDKNLIFIDTTDSEVVELAGDHSKSNPVSLKVVMSLVEDLLSYRVGEEKFQAKETVILTPYQAQYNCYLKAVRLLQKRREDLDLSELIVKKFDQFQSSERNNAIVDPVVCEKPGFLNSTARIIVGFTRARDNMWIVGNTTAWQSRFRVNKSGRPPLIKIAQYCKLNKQLVVMGLAARQRLGWTEGQKV